MILQNFAFHKFARFTGLVPHSVGDHENVEKKSGGVWPEGFPIVEG